MVNKRRIACRVQVGACSATVLDVIVFGSGQQSVDRVGVLLLLKLLLHCSDLTEDNAVRHSNGTGTAAMYSACGRGLVVGSVLDTMITEAVSSLLLLSLLSLLFTIGKLVLIWPASVAVIPLSPVAKLFAVAF